MKPRSLAPLVLGATLLVTTGCPENTYPAGDKDAYPLTDYAFFKRDEHDKAEALRKIIADTTAPATSRAEAQKALTPELLKKEKDENESLDKWRPYIRAICARLFGSPEHPTRPGAGGIPDVGIVFDDASLITSEEMGSPLETGRKLYKQHCMHCHGFYGSGDGPTANFLYPKPRDFRYGKVKFTSTAMGKAPTHDDLVRTIAQGIPGTMMPAFGPHEGMPQLGMVAGFAGPAGFDVDAVATYVEVLLMRGALENQLAARWCEDGELNKENARAAVQTVFQDWQDATASVVKPGAKRPENFEQSAKNGALLYGWPGREKEQNFGKAGCVKCHGLRGLGIDSTPEDQALDLESKNDFKLPAAPMNLTLGIYRGGRRPIDLFRRLDAGIKGTPMPGQHGNLTDEEIWNVVDFIYQLGAPKPEKAE